MRVFKFFLQISLIWPQFVNCADLLLSKDEIRLIHADKADYFDDIVTFSGDVHIKYGKRDVYSDRLMFFTKNNNVEAKGKIKLIDEKGNICTANSLVINNATKESIFDLAKLTLVDKSHISAKNAVFIDKEYFNMEDAEYSSCYNCVIGNNLTWEIKAKKVNQEKDKISYNDATFYFLGVPFLHLPYFSHESFHIKRKSGFLSPLITHDSYSGFSLGIPYLYSISRSQELIFKPIITTKIGTILWMNYNYRIPNGLLSIDTSYTGIKSVESPSQTISDYEKQEIKKIKKNNYRGHIFANFKYNINKEYRFFSNINLVSDKYYLRKVPFLKDNDKRLLENNIGIEKFTEKNYTSLRAIYFRTLRPEENAQDIPFAFPVFSHNASCNFYNGSLEIDIFAVHLDFPNLHETSKIFANIGWSKDFINDLGQVFSVNIKALSSFNKISYKDEENGKSNYKLTELSPLASLNFKWPWEFYVNANLHYILEPMIGIVGVLNKKIDTYKFNDQYTSLSLFELDDSNFMESLRSNFCGQINEVSRIPYGFRTAAYFKGENLINFIVGRSLNIGCQNKNPQNGADVNKRHSNIIFRADIFPEKVISIFSDGSYNDARKRFQRIEVGVSIKHKILDLDISSFSSRKFNNLQEDINIRGLHSVARLKINKNTSMKCSFVFGNKNKFLKSAIGFVYQNECFSSELMFSRTNFKAADIKPSKSVSLMLSFKNLGNSKINL